MCVCFFFQAEDGIRDLVRSRGLGDVYKRQVRHRVPEGEGLRDAARSTTPAPRRIRRRGQPPAASCLLYTSDAADERSSVDLGGRRIIKKKKKGEDVAQRDTTNKRKNNKDTCAHRRMHAQSRTIG